MDEDLANLPDREIIARTAWAEARSLGNLGMQLTVNTGQNRVRSGRTWWGSTLRSVFLCCDRHGVHQYSCWNIGDPNRSPALKIMETDPDYVSALTLANFALAGNLPDKSNKADSYFDRRLPRWPTWSLGIRPVFMLLPHIYFNTVQPILPGSASV